MERRSFFKLCSGTIALVTANPEMLLAGETESGSYSKVELVDSSGEPFKTEMLGGGKSFIFHYPYKSSPVLLIDLERKVPGGVGPGSSIVAFAAICTHQYSYPTDGLSSLNYVPGNSSTAGHDQAITCCLHGSAFDPAKSGAVTAGPAPKPLTGVVLDYDAGSGKLSASGIRGDDIYPEFFRAFKRELRDKYGRSGYKEEASGQAKVVAAVDYSRQRVQC